MSRVGPDIEGVDKELWVRAEVCYRGGIELSYFLGPPQLGVVQGNPATPVI